MPLAIWLPAYADFPLLGYFVDQAWFPFLMSWAGAFYDLTIPFFLVWQRTRGWAYLAVIGFHVMTGLLFQIGMFPYIMIGCTLIFLFANHRVTNLPEKTSPQYLAPGYNAHYLVCVGCFFPVLAFFAPVSLVVSG